MKYSRLRASLCRAARAFTRRTRWKLLPPFGRSRLERMHSSSRTRWFYPNMKKGELIPFPRTLWYNGKSGSIKSNEGVDCRLFVMLNFPFWLLKSIFDKTHLKSSVKKKVSQKFVHGNCRIQYTVSPGVVTKGVSHLKDCSNRVYRFPPKSTKNLTENTSIPGMWTTSGDIGKGIKQSICS